MRFFNKKLEDFDFQPQVAHPFRYKLDANGDETDVKVNLDWDERENGPRSQKDHLDKFCSLDYTPVLLDTQQEYYISDDLSEKPVDDKITVGVKTQDVYGISVNSQVINREDKVASLTFMRPIKAIHPEDLEIVQGQTYNIFVSYGIFPDEASTDTALVRGNI